MPAFWSQALTSQSAARAAGSVPPMTHPKKRPDAIAISPGSAAAASASTTAAGSLGPSGIVSPNAARNSSAARAGATGRPGTESR